MTALKNKIIPYLTAIPWLCLAIPMIAAAPLEKFAFNFVGGSVSAPWQVVNDGVMGGLSTSQFQITPNKPAMFNGIVSLENNGGFASVRSASLGETPEGCNAFKIRVRGDGQRYSFTVRNASGFRAPSYQCSFETQPDEWQEITLPFKDFGPKWRGRTLQGQPSLTPSKGDSLGFIISSKTAGAFQLEVAWIQFSMIPTDVDARR